MINGVEIPIYTPFGFYPADRTIGNGVNFQNVDNTEQGEQDWAGVYPNTFVQPVPRFWNDYTPGIDFQVYLDDAVLDYNDLRAAIIDLDGNIKHVLEKDDFFYFDAPTNTLAQVRFWADEFQITDGCYRIKIYESGGDDMYYSEVINIADTHDDCYPLEYSNFENDFGLVFTNATAETWRGKILIPLRMFKPVTEEEREVYNNDVGSLTTLRSIPKRIYEIESMPVATWFAEKIKMIFGCSDLLLNKVEANTEDGLTIEVLSETDKMEIVGNVQLNDFTDGYWIDPKIDTITELLTAWTDVNWDTFDDTGKDINEAEVDSAVATATSNSISVTEDQWYLLKFDLTGFKDCTPDLDIGASSYTLTITDDFTEKGYYVLYQAPSTTSIDIVITTLIGDYTFFESVCSFKKIS